MSITRAQAIANTREMMDATLSARWTDAFISTVLGIVSAREWAEILGANPYYRFAQVNVSTNASGQFAWTSLDTGSGDTAQTHYRVLAITDGASQVYQQTSFQSQPLATVSSFDAGGYNQWYDAGDNCQMLPVQSGLSLVVTVNWAPPRVDQLSADSVTIDFPNGSEVILWLEAAAMLLEKGGAETDAAYSMRAMAEQERQRLYQSIGKRLAGPQYLRFGDNADAWGTR